MNNHETKVTISVRTFGEHSSSVTNDLIRADNESREDFLKRVDVVLEFTEHRAGID